jgi:hypothetical protein
MVINSGKVPPIYAGRREFAVRGRPALERYSMNVSDRLRRTQFRRARKTSGSSRAPAALGGERVERIGRGQDAASKGDRVAREAPRVPGAIEVLVMVVDEVENGSEVPQRREDLDADAHVIAHVILLFRRESRGFVEHRFARADLADVVQTARQAHALDGIGIESEFAGNGGGELGDPLRVAAQEDALRLHRVDERLGDLDGHVAQRGLLALQFAGAERDLLAHEPFHAALFAEQAAPMQRALHRGLQVLEFDRLHEIVAGAARERLGGGRRVIHRGEHHHREVRNLLERHRQQLHPGHPRHAHIAQRHVAMFAVERGQRVGGRSDGGHGVPAQAEEAGERGTDRLVVVDDEHARRGHAGGAARRRR